MYIVHIQCKYTLMKVMIIYYSEHVIKFVHLLFPSAANYVMIGAEEGLFSMLIAPSQDPVMEQVHTYSIHAFKITCTCISLFCSVRYLPEHATG